MSWLKRLLGLVLLTIVLTACGKKGPLYLPNSQASLVATPLPV